MASTPRSSKFIEGSPSTGPDLPTSNSLFYTILSEMDDFESKKRDQYQHRGSQSSGESLPSSNGSPINTSHPQSYPSTKPHNSGNAVPGEKVKEGRRSINFIRSSLDKELEVSGNAEENRRRSGSGCGSEGEGHTGDKLAKKFVGRLRALTGSGREREWEVKPYAGT